MTGSDGLAVVAYYAWCMAQLTAAAVPERLRKGAAGIPACGAAGAARGRFRP